MRLRRSQDHKAVASGFLISWATNPRYFPRRPGGISAESKPTLGCSQAPSYRLDCLLTLKEVPDPRTPARPLHESSPHHERNWRGTEGLAFPLLKASPVAACNLGGTE